MSTSGRVAAGSTKTPREHVRYPFHAEVTCTAEGRTVSHLAENIGLGGLFLRTVKPLPPGTAVTLSIALPDRPEPIRVDGEVVWMVRVDPPDLERHRTGMGVRFLQRPPLDEEDLERLVAAPS